jgi:hypothetical protein
MGKKEAGDVTIELLLVLCNPTKSEVTPKLAQLLLHQCD